MIFNYFYASKCLVCLQARVSKTNKDKISALVKFLIRIFFFLKPAMSLSAKVVFSVYLVKLLLSTPINFYSIFQPLANAKANVTEHIQIKNCEQFDFVISVVWI